MNCFIVRNWSSNMCLEAARGYYESGQDLHVYTCDNSVEQEWSISNDGHFKHKDSGMVMDTFSDLSLWGNDGTSTQIWDVKDGYIYSYNGECLELGSASNFSDVYVTGCRGVDDWFHADQQWVLETCN